MIRANDSVTCVRKECFSYMYEYLYIPQDIQANNMLWELKFAFMNNYSSNGDIRRNIIEIKYMQEKRQQGENHGNDERRIE